MKEVPIVGPKCGMWSYFKRDYNHVQCLLPDRLELTGGTLYALYRLYRNVLDAKSVPRAPQVPEKLVLRLLCCRFVYSINYEIMFCNCID